VNGEQNTNDRSRPVARNERQEDEARDGRGGVSTITRVPAGPRPGARPRPAAVPRSVPEQGRPRRAPAAVPGQGDGLPRNAQAAPSAPPKPSAPGALVSALVISTTLAEGAFEITNLQNSTSAQAKQLQSLQEEVAQAQAPQQIAARATKLGMVGVGELRFVDLKTGKTATDADPNWVGNIPGYTP
jgi:hypothetical protein